MKLKTNVTTLILAAITMAAIAASAQPAPADATNAVTAIDILLPAWPS